MISGIKIAKGNRRMAANAGTNRGTMSTPMTATTIPLIQGARAAVKGYAYADRSRFETTWLDER